MLQKKTYVKPEGILTSARLVIVGEQPGTQEVFSNRVFCGPAGMELDRCLKMAGVPRGMCYLTNTFKDLDKPLGYYASPVKERNRVVGYSLSEEGQEYFTLLKNELSRAKAKVFVVTGNIPLYALTSRVGISKWRGSIIESTLVPGKLVVPCYHPSTVIRGAYLNRRLISLDLKKALRVESGNYKPSSVYPIYVAPTFREVMRYLDELEEQKVVDWDIEVYNGEVGCFSLTKIRKGQEVESMCITFVGPDGDFYSLEEEYEILTKVERLLEDPRKRVRGQNVGAFDCLFLFEKYGWKIPLTEGKLEDTMVGQKTCAPDYPAGLDFICSVYTDIPYYKGDGKHWIQ